MDATRDAPASSPRRIGALERYTGVVITHGIGDEKRNETLEEAINALTYWYNHMAGFALRPDGANRIWVTTNLSGADATDAPSSSATIELVAPPGGGAAAGQEDVCRLRIREVWWAQSLGLPSIPSALAWARMQFGDEATRVLIPFGTKPGPSHIAASAPAREIAQATTYVPHSGDRYPTSSTPPIRDESGLIDWQRAMLRGFLALYGRAQYFVKLFEWLLLVPVLYLLLLLVGVLRILGWIPGVQFATLRGISTLTGYVSLHWIAPLQTYLQDYSRSAAIRQTFLTELTEFLNDEACERVIVLAYSMGAVIAYEALSTALVAGEDQHQPLPKPVTFITYGQAIRRMWRLPELDVHRLRRALPSGVHWINLWGRYDPVPAGPLSRKALPRLMTWPDGTQPDPYPSMVRMLDAIENVDVVNTDSLLSDHISYWTNVEQVVGPIALQLVAGHPTIEAIVRTSQATPDELLERRWRIAWRTSVEFVIGVIAAGAAYLWDEQHTWQTGQLIHKLGPGIVAQLVNALLGPFLAPLGNILKQVAQQKDQLPSLTQTSSTAHATSTVTVLPPTVSGPTLTDVLCTVGMAILVGVLAHEVVKRALQPASPFPVQPLALREDRDIPPVSRLAAITLVYLVADIVLAPFIPTSGAVSLTFVGILLVTVVWLWSLYDASHTERSVWFFATLLLPLISTLLPAIARRFEMNVGDFAPPILVGIVVFVPAFFGCCVAVADALQERRFGDLLFSVPMLVVMALPVLAIPLVFVGAFVQPDSPIGQVINAYAGIIGLLYSVYLLSAPFLMYALYRGLATRRKAPADEAQAGLIFALLSALCAASFMTLLSAGVVRGTSTSPIIPASESGPWIWVMGILTFGCALLSWLLSLADALRHKAWLWFSFVAGLTIVVLGFLVILALLRVDVSGAIVSLFTNGRTQPVTDLTDFENLLPYLGPPLITSITYGLWSVPLRKAKRRGAKTVAAAAPVPTPVGVR